MRFNASAMGESRLPKHKAVMIRHTELYDDITGGQVIKKEGGGYYELWVQPFLDKRVLLSNNEGDYLTAGDVLALLQEGDEDMISRLDPIMGIIIAA